MSSSTSPRSWRRERDERGVWTLWFDQPGRAFNLLDLAAMNELDSHLDDAERDSSIVGCIIRGGKPSGFSAGIDLKSIYALRTRAEVRSLLQRGKAVIDRLALVRFPTVALIHGVCLGGGLELAMACRRRVALASMSAVQLGLPEVQFGLVPAWGGITTLPRLIDPDDAIDLLISGRSIGFLRARSLGIVDRLAAEGDPIESLETFAPAERAFGDPSEFAWNLALDRARARILDQPGQHPETQGRILSLVELDLAEGHKAASQAALEAFADLAVSDSTRESIYSFFHRRLGPRQR